MAQKRLPLFLLAALLFASSSAFAKTLKLVHDGTAFYASFYVTWSGGSKAFEGKGEGWTYNLTLPATTRNIKVRVETNKFLGAYTNACSSAAGSDGGTFTLSGLLHSESCSFVPDGATGEGSYAGIDRSTMDVISAAGTSKVFDAVATRDAKTLDKLIEAGTSQVNHKNRQGLTPLLKAVQLGDSAAVVTLLRAGADITLADNSGADALMLALMRRNPGVVETLLSQGASVSPAHLTKAVKSRDAASVQVMLAQGAVEPATVLAEAQKANQPQIMELATTNGAAVTTDVFAKAVSTNKIPLAIKYLDEPTSSIDHDAAMRLAVSKNNKQLVKAVLDKGGDPAAAMQYGLDKKDEAIVNDAVMMHGADPNMGLATAVTQQKNPQMLAVLLAGGADAEQAMSLSLNTKDARLIRECVMSGAQASDSQMRMAGQTGDVTLLKMLVQDAGGSADAGLVGALVASKWSAATALIEAGAQPQGVVAKAVTAKQMPLLQAALGAGDEADPGLPLAIRAKDKKVVGMLLKAGASTQDKALVDAVVDMKDVSMMSMLISGGTAADVGLPRAVATGQTEMVKLMLDQGADGAPDSYLKRAVTDGNATMTQLLLDAGADASAGMPEAVKAGSTPLTKLLIEAGADVTEASYLETAVKAKNTPIVRLLLDGGADAGPGLAPAVATGSVELTKLLIESGADGAQGSLASASVKHNNPALTSLLLDAGAPTSVLVSPAVKLGASKVLKLAVDGGEDVSGSKYILLAIDADRATVIPLILANGGETDYVDGAGNTLLHRAAGKSGRAVIGLLVRAGLDPNEKNAAGDAPLHIAIKQGRKSDEEVESLIAGGADVNLVDGSGTLPRDMAKGRKVKKALKNAGARKG